MKKCGRFVAGMFGTSLSLAMLSGAFLMANKGAVETNAAGLNYSWTATSSDITKFKDASNGKTIQLGDLSWTYTSDANYVGTYLNNGAIQLGKNGDAYPGGTLKTSLPDNYAISSISVGCGSYNNSSYSYGSGTIGVTIGEEVAIENQNTARWTNGGSIIGGDLDSPLSGDIVITMGASTRAYYIYSIAISAFENVTYDKIEISGAPSKTSYFVGDEFSTEGLVVTASNEAGDSKVVTDDVVWSTDVAEGGLTADDTSVKVTATYGELTATKDVAITVAERPVFTALEATGITKTSYKAGEKLDTAGLVVTAKTEDGSDSYIVPANEYTIDKTEFTFDDVVAGKATITVTYGELKATFEVDVSAMTISEFRAKDGQFGVIKGIITGRAKDSKYSNSDLYLNDGTAGIRLYRVDDKIGADLKVGDEIIISGTCDNFNETYELTNAEEVLVLDSGKSVAPTTLDSIAQDTFAGKDGLYVKIDGLHYADDGSKLWNGSKKGAMTLTKGEVEIEAYPLADSSAQDAQDYLDDFLSKIEGLPFTFTGHLGTNSGTYQIMVTASSEFSCPAYDEILNFIKTYMHMDQWVDSDASGNNECLTLFPAAKEALENLSEAQQTYFLKSDNPEIAEAQARYKAWKAAQGDQSAASVIMNTVNENKGAIIAVSAVAALGIAGAAALLISRKKRSAKNK